MRLRSWGNYPKKDSENHDFKGVDNLTSLVRSEHEFIPYGNGRSYGDSALSSSIVRMKPHNYFIDFNEESGLLHVEAGVLLSEIIDSFVPRGWFLKVTPGTKLITIGGAIASDVHGKNHHIAGCFSNTIKEFDVMLANGDIINCSKEKTPQLFKATCGGMGLTGIILNAKLYLKPINSKFIDQLTIKTENLKDTFAAFDKYKSSPYSVAWIDCLAKGDALGKCLLMVGDFRDDGKLNYSSDDKLSIPFNFPSLALNNLSVRAFNSLYYKKVKDRVSKQVVDIDTFFYPLDSIGHWNRIYGRNGFTQYQFILPLESSYEGLKAILKTIADSGKGSFLAVLKLYGEANDNYLSFPMKGYSLALDFKIEEGLFELLNKLDDIVNQYKGRIYLAKDARVSKESFEKGYPMIEKFRQFRKDNKMNNKFQSYQSQRIGI